MTEKNLLSTLEPQFLSYLVTIQSYSQLSYLRKFKTFQNWTNNGKTQLTAGSPRDTEEKKVLKKFGALILKI